MAFTITHVFGDMDSDPPIEAVKALLDELATADEEHTDVSITDESGWTLSAFPSGLVVWEDVEADDEPRHMKAVPRTEVERLFVAVAQGRLDEVETQPWQPGYGS